MINFKQERDFNALISDTFEFIRQEFKPLVKSLLTYAGPFILITAFLAAMYQSSIYSNIGNPKEINDPFWGFKEMYTTKYLLYMISAAISNVVLTLVIYSYIKLYVERGKDNFSPEDVWRSVGYYFLPVFFITIAIGFIIGFGIILFIIPGIYLAIALIFTIYAKIAENLSFGDAMRRSMYLVKDNWWFTLGILLIIYFIASFSGSIFLLPQIIYTFFIGISAAKGSFDGVSTLFLIISAAGTFIATLFYSVIYITITFHYYSLVEKKDNPGLLNEINQINEE
ncbi:MAG: hypothetical protein L3J74_13210 [Bacteroidales bacterium]|nr:hypothetical protein [Bacteroidales bacterium]